MVVAEPSTAGRQPGRRRHVDAAWWLYAHLPEFAADAMGRGLPYLLPCRSLRVPVAIWHGTSCLDGHPASVIVAGDEPWVDYLADRVFIGHPRREAIDTVPLWALSHALKRLRTAADLTIARVDRLSARLFLDGDYLAVPEWIGSWRAVPDDAAKLARDSHSIEEDLRKIRREGFTAEVSHAEADFDMFYRTMYVPFMSNRHGKHAVIRNVHQLHKWFRHGGLVWVRRRDQRLAGSLLQRREDVVYKRAIGTADGDWAPAKAGALAALYYYELQYARTQGCARVDFGGSRASLTDGLLRFKRKWGVRIVDEPHFRYDFLVHWNRLDARSVAFLAQTPLIFRRRGELWGVAGLSRPGGATQADAWMAYHSLWMPGLQGLCLVATEGWQPGSTGPAGTVLLDARDGPPRGLVEATLRRHSAAIA